MNIKIQTHFGAGLCQVPWTSVTPAGNKRFAPRKFQRGDVLMEYVVLLACLLPVLVGVQSVFAPDGNAYAAPLFKPGGEHENHFGLVGDAFHSSYTNIVMGISQPVP